MNFESEKRQLNEKESFRFPANISLLSWEAGALLKILSHSFIFLSRNAAVRSMTMDEMNFFQLNTRSVIITFTLKHYCFKQ